MNFPDFFDEIPRLRVQDPLAKFLGCSQDGVLEYGFADAVRLTGHSCPTVAAAYWLTCLALERLYPDSLPQRGGIRVDFREDARSGSTGVVATVVQMLTGAAGGTGFKGIDGRYGRVGLIRFAPDLLGSMRFTRLDTRAAVDAIADLSMAPPHPDVDWLVTRCVGNKATIEEEQRLGALWQERVRHLLIDLRRDTAVFTIRDVDRRPVLALPPLSHLARHRALAAR